MNPKYDNFLMSRICAQSVYIYRNQLYSNMYYDVTQMILRLSRTEYKVNLVRFGKYSVQPNLKMRFDALLIKTTCMRNYMFMLYTLPDEMSGNLNM